MSDTKEQEFDQMAHPLAQTTPKGYYPGAYAELLLCQCDNIIVME